MVKRKPEITTKSQIPCSHDFTEKNIKAFRSLILDWYDKHKRDLPWRRKLNETMQIWISLEPAESAVSNDTHICMVLLRKLQDILVCGSLIQASLQNKNQRVYSVWVSEIMLQQTQVSTVIDYYNKWMEKWPTIEDLAKAELEEVNELWAGLGYYSRGRRLLEGAQKVIKDMNGEIPDTSEDLLKQLPGVGRYTAGAIASIALNQVTGLVDGNVIRVLSRLQCVGCDSSSTQAMDYFWHQANGLVDELRPGDFNQAMMELGATVCTPKNPDCSSCPLKSICKANAKVERQKTLSAVKLTGETVKTEVPDIECAIPNCYLCPEEGSWDSSQGVCFYPQKSKKKQPRDESTAVCILCHRSQSSEKFLISQRPKSGLLAGMWEFPSDILIMSENKWKAETFIQNKYGIKIPTDIQIQNIGNVLHKFSHINSTYQIYTMIIQSEKTPAVMENGTNAKWVQRDDLSEAAMSTAMKKIFKKFEDYNNDTKKGTKRKRHDSSSPKKTQPTISSFFKAK